LLAIAEKLMSITMRVIIMGDIIDASRVTRLQHVEAAHMEGAAFSESTEAKWRNVERCGGEFNGQDGVSVSSPAGGGTYWPNRHTIY
jgi:hypothetical protein